MLIQIYIGCKSKALINKQRPLLHRTERTSGCHELDERNEVHALAALKSAFLNPEPAVVPSVGFSSSE